MTTPTATRHYWILPLTRTTNHWDPFCEGQGDVARCRVPKPTPSRALKQCAQGRPVALLSSAPDRFRLIRFAKFSSDPYPDPHDSEAKNLVADARAYEKLRGR